MDHEHFYIDGSELRECALCATTFRIEDLMGFDEVELACKGKDRAPVS